MTHRGRPRKYDPDSRRVLAVRLPVDLYKAVHHRAIEEETTVKSIVETALTRFLVPIKSAESCVEGEHDWLLTEAAANVTYYECSKCDAAAKTHHGETA